MTYARLLGRIVVLLEESEIAYIVTGSVANRFHGRPRATFDLDIIIDPTQRQLEDQDHSPSLGSSMGSRSRCRTPDLLQGWLPDLR